MILQRHSVQGAKALFFYTTKDGLDEDEMKKTNKLTWMAGEMVPSPPSDPASEGPLRWPTGRRWPRAADLATSAPRRASIRDAMATELLRPANPYCLLCFALLKPFCAKTPFVLLKPYRYFRQSAALFVVTHAVVLLL